MLYMSRLKATKVGYHHLKETNGMGFSSSSQMHKCINFSGKEHSQQFIYTCVCVCIYIGIKMYMYMYYIHIVTDIRM